MSSSSTNRKHLLLLFIKEPIDGSVKPTIAQEVGVSEANIRYQSIVAAILEQLVGLQDTHVRFCVSPPDGLDAVKFWLLPQLEGKVEPIDEATFLFTPTKTAAPLSLDFITADPKIAFSEQLPAIQQQGFIQGFELVSTMGANCPDCGARWIQMSTLLCKDSSLPVVGYCKNNTPYLTTTRIPQFIDATMLSDVTTLPPLHKIKNNTDWGNVLNSPIGGKISKHYNNIRQSLPN